MWRGRLVAIGLAVMLACSIPAPVLADCQPVDSVEARLAEAEVAFVGTVLRTAPGEGALLRVDEVWRGPLGSTVEVDGLSTGRAARPRGPNQGEPAAVPAPVGFAEDDRVWEVGKRYLVIPDVIEGQLVDHICSGTSPWSEELAALRPPIATLAESPAAPPAAPPWPVLIAVAVALVLALVGWLGFRRAGGTR